MALACLCAEYAQSFSGKVSALIVDHGLRPEAAAEAEQARAWCAELGLRARILTWAGDKPPSGVQAAARRARYRLLASAAVADGCGALLTAHSADDQAETLTMRLARGAGPAGLTGMRSATAIAAGPGPAVRLLRPLLDLPRASLTSTVVARGQAYIDDPSNDDERYERVRARRWLASCASSSEFFSQSGLLATSSRMVAATERLREQEATLFEVLGGVFTYWGGASLSFTKAQRALTSSAAPGLFARLIHAVGGAEFAPEEGKAARAIEGVFSSGASSLGGVLLAVSGDRLWFFREPAGLLGREGVAPMSSVALSVDEPVLWDQRFIVRSKVSGAVLRPLGADGLKALGPQSGLFHGPQAALVGLPGIFCRNRLIAAATSPNVSASAVDMRSLIAERFAGEIVRF